MGIFWEDPTTRVRRNKKQPPIPYTGWTAPTEYPRLNDAHALSVDVETCDPGLIDRGPGWGRGEGYIVGVSVGADNDGSWYFPIRHTVCCSENLHPEQTLRWLRDTLSTRQPKIGANLLYDIGWLAEEGIDVCGNLYDVQFAEALLTTKGRVNLDYLGVKYLNEGKASNTLYKWLAEMYGGNADSKQRANIYRAPPSLVGPYAESDADLPLRIMAEQAPLLKKDGLWDLFTRENKLIRLLIKMRQHGVRVDIDAAEKLSCRLGGALKKQQTKVNTLAKGSINVYANESLASAFDRCGYKYALTEKKNPSFTKNFLNSCTHPLGKAIVATRNLDKLKHTFVDRAILEHNVKGRIHCQLHPLKGETGGTGYGRFAASDPNLQQIPSRDEILAPLIRGLFIPEQDHADWIKQDASQIEYRHLAHFAVGKGSTNVRRTYVLDPTTDYHELIRQLIFEKVNRLLERKPTKSINFGLIYGMGLGKTAVELSLNLQKARELMRAYHAGAPFVRATMQYFVDQANLHGYVTTTRNRRARFDLYEPADRTYSEDEDQVTALSYDKAIAAYGPNIQRAGTYKALNYVLQGSAAEFMKEGMLQCDDAGLFDVTGVPLLTVHDELNFSNPGNCDKEFAEIKHICENAIKLRVPVLVDEERGPDWGHVKTVTTPRCIPV